MLCPASRRTFALKLAYGAQPQVAWDTNQINLQRNNYSY